MGLENIVCACGQEFEASEWSFTRECNECDLVRRVANLPPLPNLPPSAYVNEEITSTFIRGYIQTYNVAQAPPIGETYYRQNADGTFTMLVQTEGETISGR